MSEIQIKYKRDNTLQGVKITGSSNARDFAKKIFDADTIDHREEFIIITMNRANNTLGYFKVSTGGSAGTVVDPKLVFQAALNSNAASIILCHNHPSGNAKASDSDIKLTRTLIEAGKLLDMPVLDHVIVTSTYEYFSFADEGLM